MVGWWGWQGAGEPSCLSSEKQGWGLPQTLGLVASYGEERISAVVHRYPYPEKEAFPADSLSKHTGTTGLLQPEMGLDPLASLTCKRLGSLSYGWDELGTWLLLPQGPGPCRMILAEEHPRP